MTLEQAITKIDQLKKKVATDLPKKIVQIASVDIAAMIADRVVKTQTNFRGNKFSRYSTRPMLASGTTIKSRRVWEALASSKNKRRELDWVTIKRGGKNIHLFEIKGGYAELRKIEGFTNANKSFEFTTEMWRKFGVKKVTYSGNVMKITLGGKTDEAQKKINVNSKHEGVNIIAANKNEEKFLHDRVNRILQGYIKELKLN